MWTWRDLGRAIRAAWWGFFHANDLTMLRHTMWVDSLERINGGPTRHAALCDWYCRRFLDSLPIR